MSERLIDKASVFDDFTGDPTNPEDLYEYFHRTGKLYTALAVGGNRPQFSRDFMAGDEAQRTLYFAMLSNAVSTLLRHKGIPNLEEMTAYELSKAVRNLTENEVPARYKRQKTGRKNRRDSSALDALLEKAYRRYLEANKAPPGRKSLAYITEKMCKEDPSLAYLRNEITEHALRKFLQSQTKSGEI
jgi:hypothetical protein